MYKFINYIKQYIAEQFNEDSEIGKKVRIVDPYLVGHQVSVEKMPEVQIQIMDNSEIDRFSTFEKENVSFIPLQITAYVTKSKIGKNTYSQLDSSIIFGDKIKKYLNKLREDSVNPNILRVRITTTSPAMPFNKGGEIYMTSIRCEFQVRSPYVSA